MILNVSKLNKLLSIKIFLINNLNLEQVSTIKTVYSNDGNLYIHRKKLFQNFKKTTGLIYTFYCLIERQSEEP